MALPALAEGEADQAVGGQRIEQLERRVAHQHLAEIVVVLDQARELQRVERDPLEDQREVDGRGIARVRRSGAHELDDIAVVAELAVAEDLDLDPAAGHLFDFRRQIVGVRMIGMAARRAVRELDVDGLRRRRKYDQRRGRRHDRALEYFMHAFLPRVRQ